MTRSMTRKWRGGWQMPDDPLTPAEEAFRELLQDPRGYARWAARVRSRWLAQRQRQGQDARSKPTRGRRNLVAAGPIR
jgi:hypothetical protein